MMCWSVDQDGDAKLSMSMTGQTYVLGGFADVVACNNNQVWTKNEFVLNRTLAHRVKQKQARPRFHSIRRLEENRQGEQMQARSM